MTTVLWLLLVTFSDPSNGRSDTFFGVYDTKADCEKMLEFTKKKTVQFLKSAECKPAHPFSAQ